MNSDLVIMIIIVVIVSVLMYNAVVTSSDILQSYRDVNSYIDRSRENIIKAILPYLYKDLPSTEVVTIYEEFPLNTVSLEVFTGSDSKRVLHLGYPFIGKGIDNKFKSQMVHNGEEKTVYLTDNRIYPGWGVTLTHQGKDKYRYLYTREHFKFRKWEDTLIEVFKYHKAGKSGRLNFMGVPTVEGKGNPSAESYFIYSPIKRELNFEDIERVVIYD